jgi:hypothetical protein
VWGGEVNGHTAIPKSDGAALDPATSKWRTMAPTSVAQRGMALTLWTGQEMLVIGGTTTLGGPPANDGAYDPTADGWRVLPPRPPGLTGTLVGVWDGREALVLSSSRQAAAYDPAPNQWRALPPWPEPREHQLWAIASAWTGDHLLAWTQWQRGDTVAGPTIRPSGIDLWSIDPNAASPSWTQLASPAADANLPPGASAAIWTGTAMLLPAIPGGAPAMGINGYVYDPATNAYRAIAHGPVDDGSRDAVWTNGALVRTAEATVGGPGPSVPGGTVKPGDAAAWDPATNQWTVLPRAPIPGFERQLVWTGREIISYGQDIGYRFGP